MRRLIAMGLSIMVWIALAAQTVAAPMTGSLLVRVQDPAGQPIAGATVEAYALRHGLAGLATTGPDGTVRLPVPAGRQLWLLRVSAEGYRSQESGWFDPAYGGGTGAFWLEPLAGDLQVTVRDQAGGLVEAEVAVLGADGRLVANETLATGLLTRRDLPAGKYRVLVTAAGLEPAERVVTVIAGQVRAETFSLAPGGFTVTGEVLSAVTGQPLSGATAELIQADDVVLTAAPVSPTGRFQLQWPVAGDSYRLRVSAPGFTPVETAPFTAPAGSHLNRSGTDAIRLQPRTSTLAGAVRDVLGVTGIPSRVVLLLQGFGEVAETRTDDHGQFRFEGLPAGPSTLYMAVVDDAYSWQLDGWYGLMASDWVEARPGATVSVPLSIRDSRGTLDEFGAITGRVTSPQGLPVEGAVVELIRYTRVAQSTTTDAAGAFTFAPLPATEQDGFRLAPYSVRISKEGHIPTREVRLDGEGTVHFDLPARSRLELEATLRPQVFDATGRVVDPQGRPVPGARVTLAFDDQPAVAAAVTDRGGWYRLRDVPAALVAAAHLRAEAEGYLPAAADVAAALRRLDTLPTLTMTTRSSTVAGVITGPDGRPVRGVRVRLAAGDRLLAESSTDTFGYYQLQADLSRVPAALLIASRDGFRETAAVLATLPGPGERAVRDLVIPAESAVLKGRVLDADGRPVAAAEVDLVLEGQGVVARTRSGADGRYRLEEPLPDGPVWAWLRVRPPAGRFGGSITHGLEYVPMLRLGGGDQLVIDLEVRP